MNELVVKLENCYGIGKFEYKFNFSISNSLLIYAPNGTMKTSFSRTFDLVSKNNSGDLPCDRIYPHRQTVCEINVDGTPISHELILVLNPEISNFDASDKISTFIASKDLKKRHDDIYAELDSKKGDFLRKLKITSGSTDCEGEFTNTFKVSDKDTFFELLNLITSKLVDTPEKYNFRYNIIFDKNGKVKKFLEKHKDLLEEYLNNYQTLLLKSTFFKSSKNSFGTYQAKEILESINDNAFFDAGHKFTLDGDIDVKSAKELEKVVLSEINRIVSDEKLKVAFKKVDDALSANEDLREFKKVIEKDNLLLVKLNEYDNFRKELWVNYFSQLKTETKELEALYNSKKKDLGDILIEARKEFQIWNEIVEKFNSRFYVPFKVILTNQEDVILKQKGAYLDFIYNDKNEAPVTLNKESLLNILSKGEQKAQYILQLLFDIESRKLNAQKNLIIFDDIADSFDYKNKYAIIEYLKELHKFGNFKILILTHNFDFYRTVASRLSLNHDCVFMATRDDNREVHLLEGQYKRDVFRTFLDQIDNQKVFISCIPFARNLIEYLEDNQCNDYTKLTSCLHLKSDSNSINADDVFNIFKPKFVKAKNKIIAFGSKNIIDLIYETADAIVLEQNVNEILLENKVVLAIAIRLKAEKFMINALPTFNMAGITGTQTRVLFDEYKNNFNDKNKLSVLDKVILMTPENIHLNAFMYEPLIDISVGHLIDLYNKVNSL